MTDLIASDTEILAHPVGLPPGRPTVDQMVLAWLDAKAHRSGSTNTARAYREALAGFRAVLQAFTFRCCVEIVSYHAIRSHLDRQ